ncbi:prepilin-type N-terminal cleavage/methylation domain-containing protein [Candidatus Woesebacteria bacterium]|nr:prepilin-type N-terminal cleavage/methylation domain-containing protein [Candidatus Woesebacteria bacterium]
MKKLKLGFTLIEILVVVTILALLAILTIISLQDQRLRAEDVRAKTDLNRLKIAFENYYNDNSCYPPPGWFDDSSDCGSNQLAPYLPQIPCDQSTGKPYVLETDPTSCEWYKLYATFNLPDRDEQALALRGEGGSNKGNYGVSSSNVEVTIDTTPVVPSPSVASSPTPQPTPALSPLPPNHNYYWCSQIGNCTSFDHTFEVCTPYYTDQPGCDGGTNHCSVVGSCTRL